MKDLKLKIEQSLKKLQNPYFSFAQTYLHTFTKPSLLQVPQGMG